MMNKLKEYVKAAIKKVAAFHIDGAPRLMIYAFLALVFICLLAFLIGWFYNWWTSGKAELPIMIQFVGAITSATFIAAIGFFGRALIDGDDNGIPDEFEKEEDDKCKR